MRVLSQFYWPGVIGDVTRFCRSCDICQRTIPKGRVSHATLQQLPVSFRRVAVDLVGPIFPSSSKGNRYILTGSWLCLRSSKNRTIPSLPRSCSIGLLKIRRWNIFLTYPRQTDIWSEVWGCWPCRQRVIPNTSMECNSRAVWEQQHGWRDVFFCRGCSQC